LLPRRTEPAPSIEPAVVPEMASGDMSKAPPALTMKRACPPLPLF
jgi:hypothetical protein